MSCQPVTGGPMDRPEIVAAMAAAAIAGGARGVRVEGLANLRATRAVINAPIIALIKRDLSDSPVRITPFVSDVHDLAAAGADVVAVDATRRMRPEPLTALWAAIKAEAVLGMADCATIEEGRIARDMGFAIIGTTLSGYTADTLGHHDGPDLDLVSGFRGIGGFVMAEGRLISPEDAAAAMHAGADAVTIGTALTRLEIVTGWFHAAVAKAQV
ncbi:putative N-acetylmannosamine-6-phosphate 2-epimerase [Roseobacter sp. HKCC-CH-9208]|uniref:putative N-acetylmannosamine-6-phosphate 2-epimerase n=1 Tax=Roseobacter sp. HKCC-CH-9208 TaxID=3120339 RepID=UPI0030ED5AD1